VVSANAGALCPAAIAHLHVGQHARCGYKENAVPAAYPGCSGGFVSWHNRVPVCPGRLAKGRGLEQGLALGGQPPGLGPTVTTEAAAQMKTAET